jgi:hypothetical protein
MEQNLTIEQELQPIVDDLRQHLAEKREELQSNPNFNAYTKDALQNRENEIKGFEFFINFVDKNPLLQATIIASFTEYAEEIKKRINEISC